MALDAMTGNVVRDVEVSPAKSGHSTTAAPLVVRDKVIVGIAGGEFGVRGFPDAYDAKSGKRVWQFWTVPVSGESGIETRADDSWRNGSVATWLTGS